MDHQNSLQPPPLTSTKPNSKWRWTKIVIGTIAAGILAIGLLGSLNSPTLEVRRFGAVLANDGTALEVLNAGTKAITITKVVVNDRSDCKISRLSFASGPSPLPAELKIGDKVQVWSSCRVIRAAVETSQGSNTFSFTGE